MEPKIRFNYLTILKDICNYLKNDCTDRDPMLKLELIYFVQNQCVSEPTKREEQSFLKPVERKSAMWVVLNIVV